MYFIVVHGRYSALLLSFHLNSGTGGQGQFRGGDGVVREMLFRRPLTLSVLTERRVYSPFGLKGAFVTVWVWLTPPMTPRWQ